MHGLINSLELAEAEDDAFGTGTRLQGGVCTTGAAAMGNNIILHTSDRPSRSTVHDLKLSGTFRVDRYIF